MSPYLSLIARRREELPRFRVASIALVVASSASLERGQPVEIFVQFREDASSMADELRALLESSIQAEVKIIATEESDPAKWPLSGDQLIFIP